MIKDLETYIDMMHSIHEQKKLFFLTTHFIEQQSFTPRNNQTTDYKRVSNSLYETITHYFTV